MSESESVDELLADAQDALFENDVERAVAVAEQVLRVAPRENDAHEVIVMAHAARGAVQLQHAAVLRWCQSCAAKRGGLPVKVRKHALESAFLVGDRAALSELVRELIAVHSTSGSDARWTNTLCCTAALMCADVGEVELAEQLQARLTSESEEDALLQRLVIARLTGVTDQGTARNVLRQIAQEARDVRELQYVAAWAESLRLLLGAADADDVAFADELLASNISGSLSLQVAVALAKSDSAQLEALRTRHRAQASFGNVLPILRRRLFDLEKKK